MKTSILLIIACVLSTHMVRPAVDESNAAVKVIPPEHLLPKDSMVVLSIDGTNDHQSAISETAAWKALVDSGLQDHAFDLIWAVVARQSPEAAQTARRTMDYVTEHGISFAISFAADSPSIVPAAVLVLHDAAVLSDGFNEVVAEIAAESKVEIELRKQQERSIQTIPLPWPAGGEIAWWTEGQHLVISAGVDPVAQVLNTLASESNSVTSNPLWKSLRKSDKFTVSHLAWFDVAAARQRIGSLPLFQRQNSEAFSVNAFCDLLEISGVKTVTMHGGFEGVATYQTSQIVVPAKDRGWIDVLKTDGFRTEDLPPMPADVQGFVAATVDLPRVIQRVIQTADGFSKMLGEAEHLELAEALLQFQGAIGGDPAEVLTAGLGDIVCLYQELPLVVESSVEAMASGVRPVLAVQVKTRRKVEDNLRQLFEHLRQYPALASLSVRESQRKGRTVFTALLPNNIQIVPAILISDDWLFVGSSSGSVRTCAKVMDGRQPGWRPSSDTTSALAKFPQPFSSLSWSNPKPIIANLLSLAPMAVNSVNRGWPTGGERPRSLVQMPDWLRTLPTTSQVTEPLFPSFVVTTISGDSVQSHGRHSIPGTAVGSVESAAAVPVLIALLLPAVQQAREAAVRTTASNNLKQIGMAIHNYHDTHKTFPNGTVSNPALQPDQRLSWAVLLLPYLEQRATYAKIDQKSGWQSETNQNLASSPVSVFQKPGRNRSTDVSGALDYVAIGGVGADAAALPIPHRRAGVFGYDRKVRFRDITDGTSNTLAVAESTKSVSFLQGGRASIRSFSQQPYIDGPDQIGSGDGRGFQVLLADGSVRYLSADVDPKILEALSTMQGGEVIGRY